MQLIRKDRKELHGFLLGENKFVTDLFAVLSVPTRAESEDGEEVQGQSRKNSTTRAKSLTELQERLHAITSKKQPTYKDKLARKNLKNRMKKRTKQDERNAQQKLKAAQPTEPSTNGLKTAKPVYNADGKMVFSKFDFSNLGKRPKTPHNPAKVLANLEKHRATVAELEERGELQQAAEVKERHAWQNALARAEGRKVKDDEALLKKSVHKREHKKRQSQKKWDKRAASLAKTVQERQDKRQQNIDKRRGDQKRKTAQRLVKRGKIIPGY